MIEHGWFRVSGSGKSTIINSLIDTARKKREFGCRRTLPNGHKNDEAKYRHGTVQDVSKIHFGFVFAYRYVLVHRAWYFESSWADWESVHCD
jgi:ABC-type lipoprotein export system ATPase subunit